MNTARDYVTPPQLAAEWRCDDDLIREFIKSGELRAFTLSPPGCLRPRWRINREAIAEFEARRSSRPSSEVLARGRGRKQGSSSAANNVTASTVRKRWY